MLAGSIDCPQYGSQPGKETATYTRRLPRTKTDALEHLRHFSGFSVNSLPALPRHSGERWNLETVLLLALPPMPIDFLDSGLRRNDKEDSTGKLIFSAKPARKVTKKQPPEFRWLLLIPEVLGLQISEFGV